MIKFFKNMEIYNIYFFKKKKLILQEFLAKKIHFDRSISLESLLFKYNSRLVWTHHWREMEEIYGGITVIVKVRAFELSLINPIIRAIEVS